MLQFFTGKQEKPQKRVQNDISDMFKAQLQKQFCQICQKNPASKVAFGKQIKAVFTCSSCELKAVGGSPQRLGLKNLISFDKFVEILTKQLINYETSIKNPPVQYKKSAESCQTIKNKATETNTKIVQQYKKMKKVVKDKQDKIIEQSLKQNNVLIFEEVSKLMKQKKMNQMENGYLILKRALCNNKGLHFADQQAIQSANHAINDKFAAVKKQSKVKLRPLEDLIDQINNIQLE